MLFKNVAGQGVYLFAFDTINNVPKTGDALTITGHVSKDGAAQAATANTVTEIGNGLYWQPLAQAETNANAVGITWTDTTGAEIDPFICLTQGGTIPYAAAGAANGLPTLDASAKLHAYDGSGNALATASAVGAGLDNVIVETGVTGVVNDAGTPLTTINGRQALALLTSVLCGQDTGGGTGSMSFPPAGLPAASPRLTTSGADANGNRGTVSLRVPT